MPPAYFKKKIHTHFADISKPNVMLWYSPKSRTKIFDKVVINSLLHHTIASFMSTKKIATQTPLNKRSETFHSLAHLRIAPALCASTQPEKAVFGFIYRSEYS